MITLLCTLEPGRIDWLPQLVAHYRGIGVERFLLTLQLEPGTPGDLAEASRERFRHVLAGLDIREPQFLEQPFDAKAIILHQRRLQQESIAPTDWIVWCDSDEFQVYPQPLPSLAAWCDAQGIDFLRGLLIDRVAADGRLMPFSAERAVWETYPVACNVTARLGRGDPRKVTMTRGDVLVSGGKHTLVDPAKRRTIAGWVQIHHFKWDATVIDRLQFRVRPEWKAKCAWWTESQRLLDYFAAHGGGFAAADLAPIPLPGNDFMRVA
jgi:hypothetical protein